MENEIKMTSNETDFSPNTLISHGGWIAAILVAAWGWVLRFALKQHLIAISEVNARLSNIEARLSRLEGRFEEKDHEQ